MSSQGSIVATLSVNTLNSGTSGVVDKNRLSACQGLSVARSLSQNSTSMAGLVPGGDGFAGGLRPSLSASSFMSRGERNSTDVTGLEVPGGVARIPSRNSYLVPVEPQPQRAPKPQLVEEDEEEPGFRQRLKEKCRQLSDNFRFNVLTTVLTIYALFGDDFRLVATEKWLDMMFNLLTILSIAVFIFEIVVQSIGKEDYFLSFFCNLDIMSTATLVFDLTWIGNMIFCTDAESGSALRSSRAGRAGARAGRTVRIIRLMRLVKLYAKYMQTLEENQKKKELKETRRRMSSHLPGDLQEEPDFDKIDSMNSTEFSAMEKQSPKEGSANQAETRVGKKLGEMTTRRVICLVLAMLFVMPQFSPSSHGLEDFLTSMDIGMELIYERFRQYCPLNSTAPPLPWCLQSNLVFNGTLPTPELARKRNLFEDFFLELVYAHQGTPFAHSLYWVGVQSKSLIAEVGEAKAGQLLADLAYLGQDRFLGKDHLHVDDWDARYADQRWATKIATLSASSKRVLEAPWAENCVGTFWGAPLGFQLSDADYKNEAGYACSIERDLRCSEVEYMAPLSKTQVEANNFNIVFAFNTRVTTVAEAGLNMLQTVFICVCVGVGAMTFSSDADKLLLKPIERMIAKMETIKDNPLEAMRLGDMEYRREEIEKAKRQEKLSELNRFQKIWHAISAQKVKQPMETAILEKTIIKLGGLLALGFGEAGAEIIGHNMGHSTGVDAMVPGSKVEAIFGHCTIHHFTMVNQVLKESVMIFVNRIGEIVHGCVDDFNGAANKNIGDSFLLIWRLAGFDNRGQRKLADMAIMSFIRIVTEVNKSPVLAAYRKHPGVLQRIPDFRVSMGYGMHCGWAIEGAIGSDFKIDASYLSPNVNVAAVLSGAVRSFGVWLLMSHAMMTLCSRELSMMCRLIDHVVVKGERQPLRLFTIDLDYMSLSVETDKDRKKFIKNRFKIRQIREIWKQEKWAEEYHVFQNFELDGDIAQMRFAYSPEFFRRFSTAYRNYETGSWKVARDLLFTCFYNPRRDLGYKLYQHVEEHEWPPDGPTRSILKIMQKHHFQAPPHWPGYRFLKEGPKH